MGLTHTSTDNLLPCSRGNDRPIPIEISLSFGWDIIQVQDGNFVDPEIRSAASNWIYMQGRKTDEKNIRNHGLDWNNESCCLFCDLNSTSLASNKRHQ